MPEKIRSKAFSRPHYVARLSLTAGAGEGHSHQPMDDALCLGVVSQEVAFVVGQIIHALTCNA
jgi:hypothetical protein